MDNTNSYERVKMGVHSPPPPSLQEQHLSLYGIPLNFPQRIADGMASYLAKVRALHFWGHFSRQRYSGG